MSVSHALADFSIFNGIGILLTLIAVLLFLIFLAYSLVYLKDLSSKIIYLIRVASKVSFSKHKKRQAKKKAKYVIAGVGEGDNKLDSDDQEPQDQFYQELKNNWKKQIYNDRVGRFKSLFYSILLKYNYQLFCCCKVKKFNTLNEYDLLRPAPAFQWLLFGASIGTLWYISVFLAATLHVNTQYDARDLADLTFLFYLLIICLVASPSIIFIIWALWRYYNKTISHAMTTGNKISKRQRQGIYYDFRDSQDSLIGLAEFQIEKTLVDLQQENRSLSVYSQSH